MLEERTESCPTSVAVPAPPDEGLAQEHWLPGGYLHGILGHGSNTVAANYGLGYAQEVIREHMEK